MSTVNDDLRSLGLNIIPDDEYLRKAGETADKIAKYLQAMSKYRIGKMCVAGSLGKKTTIIMGWDIDVVLFINGEEPPFKDVIAEFEDILTLCGSFDIRGIRTTEYSVQFKAGVYDFDLLPATNFTPNVGEMDKDKLIDLQQESALNRIRQNPERFGYMFSSSLAQTNVRFMKSQEGFINEMVRIAKFWFKSLHFDEYTSGAKSLIELVAVFVANNEVKKYNERSYQRCFADIIQKFQNFDSLNVVFEDEYEKIRGHQVLDVSRPRVMDPSNPYNNLAKNWSESSKQMIKKYAGETYRRLGYATAGRLNVVFEPQPVFLSFITVLFGRAVWLSSIENVAVSQIGVKIRKDDFLEKPEKRVGFELVKMYLFNAWSNSMVAPNTLSLRDALQRAINKHVFNRDAVWKSAFDNNHDDYDGTFTFPVNNKESVLISFKF